MVILSKRKLEEMIINMNADIMHSNVNHAKKGLPAGVKIKNIVAVSKSNYGFITAVLLLGSDNKLYCAFDKISLMKCGGLNNIYLGGIK